MRRFIAVLCITLASVVHVIAAGPSAPSLGPCSISPISGNTTVCANSGVSLSITSTDQDGMPNTADWTTSGDGTFDLTTATDVVYTPGTGDASSGSVIITATNSDYICGNSKSITLTITPAPTISINVVNAVCASTLSAAGVGMKANYTLASGVVWSAGSGTFSPATNLDSVNYSPSATDLSMGYMMIFATTTGVGTCNPVVASAMVTLEQIPTVDAGADISACTDQTSVSLIGTTNGNPDGVTWTGGNNNFSNSSGLYNDYYPDGADVAAGSVTLTLSVTNYGACPPGTDNVLITFQSPSAVSAGTDIDLCSSTASGPISLTGTTTGTNPYWSGGSGTFSDQNALITDYTPAASELVAGKGISLTLMVSSAAPCLYASDDIMITVYDPITVDAGTDAANCPNSDAWLYPSIMGVWNTAQWGTSGTGTFNDANSPYTYYIFSPADVANGTVDLTLTVTPYACSVVSDITTITVLPAVTVDAGPDQNVCITDISSIQLAGVVNPSNDPFIGWYVVQGTDVSLADDTDPATICSVGDPTNTSIVLELSAGDSEVGCGVVSDTVIINIMQLPVASFPQEQICADGHFDLIASNATTVVWGSTDGTGTFIPSPTALDVDYTPSAADVTRGTVTFNAQITSLGCAVQNVTAANPNTIHPLPVVNAGIDQFVCSPSALILTGSPTRTGSDQETWTYSSSAVQSISDVDGVAAVTVVAGSNLVNEVFTYTYKADHSYVHPTLGTTLLQCIASDQTQVTFLNHPVTVQDVLAAPAGIEKTMNLVANDNTFGLTYTVVPINNGKYMPPNSVSIDATGLLTYTNRTPFLAGSDTLQYRLDICTVSQYGMVVVNLVNGPPIYPDSSSKDTSVTPIPKTVLEVPVDFASKLYDYNGNINWGDIHFISSTSGATAVFNNTSIITFRYASMQASQFAGRDEIVFYVKDYAGDSLIVRYYVDIVPDYENPAVKPDDFIVINAVSPNGDGVNDFMYVYGLTGYHNTVVLYNRWSQEVWRGEEYDNKTVRFEGEGNVKGLEGPLPEGTYFYIIKNESKDQNGERTGLYSGYIELRR